MAEIHRLPGAVAIPVVQTRTRGGKFPQVVTYLPEVRLQHAKAAAPEITDTTEFRFGSLVGIKYDLLAGLSALPRKDKCFAAGYLNKAVSQVLDILKSKEVPHG